MKKIAFLGFIGIIMVFGFFGCDTGNVDDEPIIVIYEGYANGNEYILKITDNSSYDLNVDNKTSTGTASKNENIWTLKPSIGNSFTVEINSSGITNIIGIITFIDGNTLVGPGAIVQINKSDLLEGTWEGDATQGTPASFKIVSANGIFSQYVTSGSLVNEEFVRGTYTISENIATGKIFEVKMDSFGYINWTPFEDLTGAILNEFPDGDVIIMTITNNRFIVYGVTFIRK
jgi:hypothetical protein